MVGSSNNYGRLFLFVAALAVFAGLANAAPVTDVHLLTPTNNSVGASTTVNLTWNVSTNYTLLNCTINVSFTQNLTTFFTNLTVNVTNDTILGVPVDPYSNVSSTYIPGNYTWQVNCTNWDGVNIVFNNSSKYFFSIDTTAPTIAFANFSPGTLDTFVSPSASEVAVSNNLANQWQQNQIINMTVNITDEQTNATLVNATLLDYLNRSIMTTSLNYVPAWGQWNGSFNVTATIRALQNPLNDTMMNSTNLTATYHIWIQAQDAANHTLQGSVLNNFTAILEDFGSYQGPPSTVSSCIAPASITTNLSNVTNFYAVNLVEAIHLNGSAACMYNLTGVNVALPWGNESKLMAMYNFTSVDLSNATAAASVMSAMGSLIQPSIYAPRSFIASRIFVNSTALSVLNTSANVTLYNLPFSSPPNVTADNGTVYPGVTWWQGGYNASFNSTTGNLSVVLTTFSGYNVSDIVPPFINQSIIRPLNGNFSKVTAVTVNASVNGTGSEVSKVVINVTKDSTTNFTYVYDNTTINYNDAHCYAYAQQTGSENVTCNVTTPTLSEGLWTLMVSAYDYGTPSPGNFNSTITTFVVDNSGPVVTQNYPENGAYITGMLNTTYLIATAYDSFNATITCDVTFNESLWYANLSFTNNTAKTIYVNYSDENVTNASFNWSLNCWDALGNNRTTGIYSFYVGASGVQGNESDVTATGLGTTGVYVNDAVVDPAANYSGTGTVNITSGIYTIVNYSYNLSHGLNFSQITITNASGTGINSADAVYIKIRGVNTSGGLATTKAVYMYNVPAKYNSVCVKNSDSDPGDYTVCTGSNEVPVLCDGVAHSGITCTSTTTATGTVNLVITGAQYTTIWQFSPSSGTGTTTSGTSGGSGGGSGAGGAGTPSTAGTTNDYTVDVGAGKTCTVTVSREIAPTTEQSIMTTTLENTGGADCVLEEFVFADTIPDSFSAVNEIAFSPAYASREGWTVSFGFPSFASGESKTLTYTVNKWVAPSKLEDFTSVSLSAKKSTAAPAPTPTPTETPGTTEQPSGTTPAPAPAPTPAPTPAPVAAPAAGGLGGLLSGATLLVILVAVVIVVGAVYFLAVKGKRKGL